MKSILCLFIAIATAVTARADNPFVVPMNFSISATAYVQNTLTTTFNGVTTTAAPVKYSVTTKSVLNQLAASEYASSNYPSAFFPLGAKLVFLDYPQAFTNSCFVVEDSTGNIICNVSNLLTYSTDGNDYAVQTGKVTTGGLLDGSTQTYVASVTYDDTQAGGVTQFFLGGLVVATGKDTAIKNTASFTETFSGGCKSAVGNGRLNGKNLYITGSFSAAGSAVFTP
jgi:hypothetical protein